MRPVISSSSTQPFLALSNQKKKMLWYADIGIGDVGVVTMLN